MIRIAIAGNSNAGKTSTLNALTDSVFATGNFCGTTVDINEVFTKHKGQSFMFYDTPGFDSFNETNETTDDNRVSINFLKDTDNYDLILQVIDSNELETGLKLNSELKKLNKKMLVLLNFANEREIDISKISKQINQICISFNPNDRSNAKKIKDFIALNDFELKNYKQQDNEQRKIKSKLNTKLIDKFLLNRFFGPVFFLFVAFTVFVVTFKIGDYPSNFIIKSFSNFMTFLQPKIYLVSNDFLLKVFEFLFFISKVVVLPSFLMLFSFLPKIIILFFFLSIMESTGYLPRIEVLFGRVLTFFGMSGSSAISLISAFGCSIPAYLSTRRINNRRQKIITMIAVSLVPCSAKVIVFSFVLSAFFPSHTTFAMFAVYFCAIFLAFAFAKITDLIFKKNKSDQYDEKIATNKLPEYRLPNFMQISRRVNFRSFNYIKNIMFSIMLYSFVVWFLSHIPFKINDKEFWGELKSVYLKSNTLSLLDENDSVEILKRQNYIFKNSVVGKVSSFVHPIFKPLGLDWKMTASVFFSVSGKEVSVGVLNTLYSNPNETSLNYRETISNQVPKAAAVSYVSILLILFPCISAISVFLREIKSKKLFALIISSNVILTWVITYFVYRIALLFLH